MVPAQGPHKFWPVPKGLSFSWNLRVRILYVLQAQAVFNYVIGINGGIIWRRVQYASDWEFIIVTWRQIEKMILHMGQNVLIRAHHMQR